MNKYQEAFEKARLCCLCTDTAEEAHEYLNVLKELVEKATPHQLDNRTSYSKRFKDDIDFFVCPRCHTKINNTLEKYCKNCGQAIDWSDEEWK